MKKLFIIFSILGLLSFLGCKNQNDSESISPEKIRITALSPYLVKVTWPGKEGKVYQLFLNDSLLVYVSGSLNSYTYAARERGLSKGDCFEVEGEGGKVVGKACVEKKQDHTGRQPPPPSPSPLMVEVTGKGKLLEWKDKSNRELGYQILRCEDVEGGCSIIDYEVIAEVGRDVTEYSDSFTGDACYRIIAFGKGGRSGYSNEVCVIGGRVERDYSKSCYHINAVSIEGEVVSGEINTGTNSWQLLPALWGAKGITLVYQKGFIARYGRDFPVMEEFLKDYPPEETESVTEEDLYSSDWWNCGKGKLCGDIFYPVLVTNLCLLWARENYHGDVYHLPSLIGGCNWLWKFAPPLSGKNNLIMGKWFGTVIDPYSVEVTSESIWKWMRIDPGKEFILLVIMKMNHIVSTCCDSTPIVGFSFNNPLTAYVVKGVKKIYISAQEFNFIYAWYDITMEPDLNYHPYFLMVGIKLPKRYMDYDFVIESREDPEYPECVSGG